MNNINEEYLRELIREELSKIFFLNEYANRAISLNGLQYYTTLITKNFDRRYERKRKRRYKVKV